MKPYNVGMIGYGWAAQAHIPAINAGTRAQFREVKALLDRGVLGRLHYAEVDYYHGIGPWYREFEWCTTVADCGSGLLVLEAGCHALDAILLCLPGEVEEVFSWGAKSAHPYQAQFEAFFAALERDEDMPLTGLAEAVRTHEVLFAADRLWQEKRPVKLTEIRAI